MLVKVLIPFSDLNYHIFIMDLNISHDQDLKIETFFTPGKKLLVLSVKHLFITAAFTPLLLSLYYNILLYHTFPLTLNYSTSHYQMDVS